MVSHPEQRRERRRQTLRAERARGRLAIFWIVYPATIALVIAVAFVLKLTLS